MTQPNTNEVKTAERTPASGPIADMPVTPPVHVPRDVGERQTLEFTSSQEAIIRRMYAPGTTDDEFNVFLYVCKATGLNPLARQIHAMKRKQDGENRLTIQTGIDGFRIVAERTGRYAGQTPPEWCGDDGKWRDVWPLKTPPVAARVGIHMRGFQAPLYAVAHYDEYVQRKRDGTPNRMWKTMPANQLAKCAEALALRKSAPQELSGIYTSDEMAQADNDTRTAPASKGAPTFPLKPHSGKPLDSPDIKTSHLVQAIEWCYADTRRAERMEPTADAMVGEIVRRVRDGVVQPDGVLLALTLEQLQGLLARIDKSPVVEALGDATDAIVDRISVLEADDEITDDEVAATLADAEEIEAEEVKTGDELSTMVDAQAADMRREHKRIADDARDDRGDGGSNVVGQ